MNRNQKKVSDIRLESLTKREKEILLLNKAGLTAKEIAHKEGISFNTVKKINRNITLKANKCGKMIKAIYYFFAFDIE